MAVIHVNESNYQEIAESGKTVLLDFFAEWCGPCRMVSPLVERLSDEHPEIVVAKVNVDDEQDLAAQYGVMSIPTLVVLKDGKVAKRNVGAIPYDAIVKLVTEA